MFYVSKWKFDFNMLSELQIFHWSNQPLFSFMMHSLLDKNRVPKLSLVAILNHYCWIQKITIFHDHPLTSKLSILTFETSCYLCYPIFTILKVKILLMSLTWLILYSSQHYTIILSFTLTFLPQFQNKILISSIFRIFTMIKLQKFKILDTQTLASWTN